MATAADRPALAAGPGPALASPRTRASETTLLHLHHLEKRYGDVVALDRLSLVARPGRILGFLGPNGAGKTTAMRSVFGLVELDDGRVTWRDQPITAETRLRFGYMPEQRGLYPRMHAGAQLAYVAELHGVARATADAAAREWLERLGLADRHDEPVSSLSHGNQQRVQLAASLVHDPELMVLDEPFSGLDPLGVAAMSEVLAERAAAGATVVFSSHQLDLVEDLVDDVLIIANGRDQMAGTLEDVRASTGVQQVTFRLDDGRVPDVVAVPDGDADRQVQVRPGRDGLATLQVATGTDPAAVMAALGRHGSLARFSFEPPSLSQVFRSVVGISIADAEAARADDATTREVVT